MRVWHQLLIPYLPRQQLLGQHRELAALRGLGWGRKHSTVDYVFTYDPDNLVAFHYLVMDEMEKRGYHPDPIWKECNWRGNKLGIDLGWSSQTQVNGIYNEAKSGKIIYFEHDDKYLRECLKNLEGKGIIITMTS